MAAKYCIEILLSLFSLPITNPANRWSLRDTYVFMENSNIIEALSNSELFGDLDQVDLGKIASRSKVRQFFAHDIIVWQGESSTALFLIMNGIVAVKNVVREKENLLAYLMPGNTFGEVGILENQVRSASVVALSEVDVVAIQRDDFLEILHQHSRVAISLARILGRYLIQSNRRRSKDTKGSRLVVIFNTLANSGSTSFGTLLAEKMAKMLNKPTAYLEYPNPWRALNGFQLEKNKQVYHHGEGFDILLPQEDVYLPSSTRTTLMMDKVRSNYDNLVIKIQDTMDESMASILEHANQVIILSPPTKLGLKQIEKIQKKIKGRIRPEETGVLTIINRNTKKLQEVDVSGIGDFEIPYMKDFPTFQLPMRAKEEIPKVLEDLLENCVERLERTNSIGIFIPTTTDVDRMSDTTMYMDKTMNFMAERFGGATCKVANGVWHSEKLGLVGEVVYIVHSYITQTDMNHYLDEVVEYIKLLKRELNQEAMALEVNHKLTLI